MKSGFELITEERKRQVEVEGWTPEHDDQHTTEDLVSAAACYLNAMDEHEPVKRRWPWALEWWKPKDRVRNLVRSGALYLAANDRDRRHGIEPPESREATIYVIGQEIDKLQKAAMELARAHKIVGDCVQNAMRAMGLYDDAPDLSGYSLEEMLEAGRLVSAENLDGPGPKEIHVVCDPRLLAALYVAHHYDGDAPNRAEPIAYGPGTAVVVVKTEDRP